MERLVHLHLLASTTIAFGNRGFSSHAHSFFSRYIQSPTFAGIFVLVVALSWWFDINSEITKIVLHVCKQRTSGPYTTTHSNHIPHVVYTHFICPIRQVSFYYHSKSKTILSLATFPALGNSSESSRTFLSCSLGRGFPSNVPVLRWLSSNLYLALRQLSACAPFRSLVASGAGSSAVVRRRISREQIQEEIPAKNQERKKKLHKSPPSVRFVQRAAELLPRTSRRYSFGRAKGNKNKRIT